MSDDVRQLLEPIIDHLPSWVEDMAKSGKISDDMQVLIISTEDLQDPVSLYRSMPQVFRDHLSIYHFMGSIRSGASCYGMDTNDDGLNDLAVIRTGSVEAAPEERLAMWAGGWRPGQAPEDHQYEIQPSQLQNISSIKKSELFSAIVAHEIGHLDNLFGYLTVELYGTCDEINSDGFMLNACKDVLSPEVLQCFMSMRALGSLHDFYNFSDSGRFSAPMGSHITNVAVRSGKHDFFPVSGRLQGHENIVVLEEMLKTEGHFRRPDFSKSYSLNRDVLPNEDKVVINNLLVKIESVRRVLDDNSVGSDLYNEAAKFITQETEKTIAELSDVGTKFFELEWNYQQGLKIYKALNNARGRIFTDVGELLISDSDKQEILADLLVNDDGGVLTGSDRDVIQRVVGGDLGYAEGVIELGEEGRAFCQKAINQKIYEIGNDELRQNKALFYETARSLYLSGEFEDPVEAMYVYEFIEAARLYCPDYFFVEAPQEKFSPPQNTMTAVTPLPRPMLEVRSTLSNTTFKN